MVRRSALTAILLLMSLLLQSPVLTAKIIIDTSSLIEKDAEIHHKKWFLRYSVQRPTVHLGLGHSFSPLFGHFQVALRDPEDELIYHRTFSFEELPITDSPSTLLPLVQTIKISKLIKGRYTLFITLLDRNSDAGVFDAAGSHGSVTPYFLDPFLFDEHKQISLSSTVPAVSSIAKPTDPSQTTEQLFTLHLP